MSILICVLLWSLSLSLQAFQEPKMLRFARLQRPSFPKGVGGLRFALPVLALILCFVDRASTAVLVWAGTASVAALVVALGWAAFARYRERSVVESGQDR